MANDNEVDDKESNWVLAWCGTVGWKCWGEMSGEGREDGLISHSGDVYTRQTGARSLSFVVRSRLREKF